MTTSNAIEVTYQPGTYQLCRNGPGNLFIKNLGPGVISFPDAGAAGQLRPQECAMIVKFQYVEVRNAPVTLQIQP